MSFDSFSSHPLCGDMLWWPQERQTGGMRCTWPMGWSPGQLLSLLPSGLLRWRKEAWPPALLLEGKCRFLGSQSTASGINLLAIWPGPYFSEGQLHTEVEQRV